MPQLGVSPVGVSVSTSRPGVAVTSVQFALWWIMQLPGPNMSGETGPQVSPH